MSKLIKKTVSLFLSIAMVVTMFSFPVFADQSQGNPASGTSFLEETLNTLTSDIKISDLLKMILGEKGAITISDERYGTVEITDISIPAESDQGILMLFDADYVNSLKDLIEIQVKLTGAVTPGSVIFSGTVGTIVTQMKDYFEGETAQILETRLLEAVYNLIEELQAKSEGKTLQDVKKAFDDFLVNAEQQIKDLQARLALAPEQANAYLKEIIDKAEEQVNSFIALADPYLNGSDKEIFKIVADSILQELEDLKKTVEKFKWDETEAMKLAGTVLERAAAAVASLQEISGREITVGQFPKAFNDALETIRSFAGDMSGIFWETIADFQKKCKEWAESFNFLINSLEIVTSDMTGDELKGVLVLIVDDYMEDALDDLTDLAKKRLAGEELDNFKNKVAEIKTIYGYLLDLFEKNYPAEGMKDILNTVIANGKELGEKLTELAAVEITPESTGKFLTDALNEFRTAAEGMAKQISEVVIPHIYDTYDKIKKDLEDAVKGHDYKTITTPADMKKNGSITRKCSICGWIDSVKTIKKIKTVSLSKTSYGYNGKVQKPAVTVKDSAGKAISSKYYTLTYSNKSSKKVGSYTVTVKFKGNYSGSTELTYKIVKAKNPTKLKVPSKTYKKTTLSKAKSFTIGASKAQGKVTYTLSSKAKKAGIKVTAKGKVTVPKGCAKGTYKITVKAKGNTNYKAGTETVTVKVS